MARHGPSVLNYYQRKGTTPDIHDMKFFPILLLASAIAAMGDQAPKELTERGCLPEGYECKFNWHCCARLYCFQAVRWRKLGRFCLKDPESLMVD
ncbi:hypothetical protein D8B26_001858 [Coccidioides posadasii str. Silveira]|uniref:Predicted protein n=1 Tax=Coccidioides posadasii (strain RMSCC 757 / Silveira) TaxID=443226 RepID=E9CWN3_COCPS|nr:predicted protein [Coccidioides posadasii str. Silveira]QVM07154.1 hypothetical protein D8B26_001858 [Coccidioides posadasii str. Silveira]